MYKFFTTINKGRYSPYPIGKILLIMKLTVFLLTIGFIHLHAASFAQRISIKANNVSLEQVFGEIKKQTRYDFVYEEALIKRIAPINVNIQNLGIEAALQQILQDKALDYSVTDKIVTIKRQLAGRKNS